MAINQVMAEQYSALTLEDLALQAWRLNVPTSSRFWNSIKRAYASGNYRLMASLCYNESSLQDSLQARVISQVIRERLAARK